MSSFGIQPAGVVGSGVLLIFFNKGGSKRVLEITLSFRDHVYPLESCKITLIRSSILHCTPNLCQGIALFFSVHVCS